MPRLQNDHRYNFAMEKVDNLPIDRSFYRHVIEISGGVPFQLNFGSKMGEGIYLNPAEGIRQLFGIEPKEFTEQYFQGIIEKVVPLNGDITTDQVLNRSKFLTGKIRDYSAEILVRTNDGKKKWIKDTSVPVMDEKTGRVTGAFGILYDITESRHMQENLERIKQKENELEQLKASFLKNMSHEIRTPLNAIVGFSALIGECNDGIYPDRWTEFRDIIISNSDRLLEMIDSILEISKIESGTVKVFREKVNLNWILLKIYAQFRVDASEKSIHMNFVTGKTDKEADVYTDGFKLKQVLGNIVGNALKFTNEGRIEFGYTVLNDKIEFYVADTGIGIPPEHQDGIFRMFYQAESGYARNYGGIGLGLTISKAYIELLEGSIWFTSRYGEGSEFRFTLPYENAGIET